MQLLLDITGGPATGERILLRQGQVAHVGRTEWADFSVPDAAMNDLHFAVMCEASGCCLQDLEDSYETQLNGKPVVADRLATGDTIQAGTSMFVVRVLDDGLAEEPSTFVRDDAIGEDAPEAAATPAAPMTLAEICELLELTDEAKAFATAVPNAEALVQRLASEKLFGDAVCVRAYTLPKPQAVRWAVSCVRDVIPAPTQLAKDALRAAEQWSAKPNEDHRRIAETAALANGYADCTSWIALAAFWSEGSMSAPGQPAVPPAEHLTAKAITGALMMAATCGDLTDANGRYTKWLGANVG